jgi:hypothetical protein
LLPPQAIGKKGAEKMLNFGKRKNILRKEKVDFLLHNNFPALS